MLGSKTKVFSMPVQFVSLILPPMLLEISWGSKTGCFPYGKMVEVVFVVGPMKHGNMFGGFMALRAIFFV